KETGETFRQSFSPIPADVLKRWGKATLALEQQSGHIDAPFIRRLLCDQFDACAGSAPGEVQTVQPIRFLAGIVAELSVGGDGRVVTWWSRGPTGCPLYFPILLDGDIPHPFTESKLEDVHRTSIGALLAKLDNLLGSRQSVAAAKETIERLQGRFDQQLDEFL